MNDTMNIKKQIPGELAPDEVNEHTRTSSGASSLLRLVWMLAGNAVLAILVVSIAQADSAVGSFVSIAFWMVVGLILLARYVDVTRYKGFAADGVTPATMKDVKQFSAGLVGLAAAAWVLAHAI